MAMEHEDIEDAEVWITRALLMGWTVEQQYEGEPLSIGWQYRAVHPDYINVYADHPGYAAHNAICMVQQGVGKRKRTHDGP